MKFLNYPSRNPLTITGLGTIWFNLLKTVVKEANQDDNWKSWSRPPQTNAEAAEFGGYYQALQRVDVGLEYGMDLRIYWFYGPEPTWILQPFVRSSLRSGGGYRETRVGSGGITIGKGFSVDFIGEEALEKLKSRISQLEGGVQS
tara:strand:- start:1234 stop:1668 length:435 start_codon:yes stop_codon:yes gene_type:complete